MPPFRGSESSSLRFETPRPYGLGYFDAGPPALKGSLHTDIQKPFIRSGGMGGCEESTHRARAVNVQREPCP